MIKKIRIKLNTISHKISGMKVGNRSAVYPGAEISDPSSVKIGDDAVIYKQVSVLSDNTGSLNMGHRSHVAPFSYLLIGTNKLEIGDDVAIGPFTSIFCLSNKVSKELHRNSYHNKNVKIGNNVFVGAQTIIMPGTVIDDNVVVSANSTVMGHLKSGGIYSGNPAKRIREIDGGN
ncbi:MAG: hypothetical protein HKN22_05645 [Bacteroidia bacterium]|nr:hypothetical protein [Bacteroidia bacterium]